MERVGIRELRASAAAAVRRAEGGQTTVITVGGRPVAQLGPLTSHGAERSLDVLVAQGLLIAPRRSAARVASGNSNGSGDSGGSGARVDSAGRSGAHVDSAGRSGTHVDSPSASTIQVWGTVRLDRLLREVRG